MTQVVFVHGVSTRKDEEGTAQREKYMKRERKRNEFFKRVFQWYNFQKGEDDTIVRNPYWGDLATELKGPEVVEKASDGTKLRKYNELEAIKFIPKNCEALPVINVEEDQDLMALDEDIKKLMKAIEAQEWETVFNLPVRGANMLIVYLLRKFSRQIAVFIGDSMIYIKEGKEIRNKINKDIAEAAREAKKNKETLVLVGHSMGANIIYDILTDPTHRKTLDDQIGNGGLPEYLFISVGTQIGLFEELKLFSRHKEYAPQKPEKCFKWWHVYKTTDALSFAINTENNGLFELNNGADSQCDVFYGDYRENVIEAHTGYFDFDEKEEDPAKQPPCFRHLRGQLDDL